MSHPLLSWFVDVAEGRHPPADGSVTFLLALPGGLSAVAAFTGHAVVASRFGADELTDLALDGYGGALSPSVLLRLADGGGIGVNDVTLAARGHGSGATLASTTRWDTHPRVRYARSLRSAVQVLGDERGFVTLADGLAGRLEMSIEVAPELHGSGTGRVLIERARAATPADRWLFAAVSPGNARSLRAFLAAGFVPIGSEVIITPA